MHSAVASKGHGFSRAVRALCFSLFRAGFSPAKWGSRETGFSRGRVAFSYQDTTSQAAEKLGSPTASYQGTTSVVPSRLSFLTPRAGFSPRGGIDANI